MKCAVLSFPGSSCDIDLFHAVQDAMGASVEIVWHAEADLTQYDVVFIPTGASYGDYLRPGALAKSSNVVEQLQEFAAAGKVIVGVGNGFQILVEIGLLPGAFLQNARLKFRSGHVRVNVETTDTIFTSAYQKQEQIILPIAHAYGAYYADSETIETLQKDHRIVFTYAADDHLEGSTAAIAGIINEKGNVLGMMPLPERAVEEIIGGTDGLPLFQSILKNGSEQHVSQA